MAKGQQRAPRRGRPQLPKNAGKRFAIGARVTEATRRALEEAAEKSGRSISQELEMRLEKSFTDEESLGGREMVGLFRMMAGAAAIIEERLGGTEWSSDWLTFLAVERTWHKLINGSRPVPNKTWVSELQSIQEERLKRPMPPEPKGAGLLNQPSQEEYEQWMKQSQAFWGQLSERLERLQQVVDAPLALGDEVAKTFLISPNQTQTMAIRED